MIKIRQAYIIETKDGKMTVERAAAGGVIIEQFDAKDNKIGQSMEYSLEEIDALLEVLPNFRSV